MFRFTLILLCLCLCARAQPPKDPAVSGSFHLNVDDGAILYINGILAHRTKALGKSKSIELPVKPGDRIVVQLGNVTMPRYFIMAFVSADKKTVVSFPKQSLKVLPDAEAMDFTEYDFKTSNKMAKSSSRKRDGSIPFKHNSDYVWGEFDNCALGCIITPQMFVPLRQ